jgi:hypothetical protein
VDHAGDGADVDGTVQHLPALAAERRIHPVVEVSARGISKTNPKAYGDEWALGDVFPHRGQAEGLVGTNVGEEVQARVKKRRGRACGETDEIRQVEKFAKRSDGQGDTKRKIQSPVAC